MMIPGVSTRGPWHCTQCRQCYRSAGTRDITLDQDLIQYLNGAMLPASVLALCKHATRYVTLAADGSLYVQGRHYTKLEVPLLYFRLETVRRAAGSLAFPDGNRLHQLLHRRFFWLGLQRDCLLVARLLVCTQQACARVKA